MDNVQHLEDKIMRNVTVKYATTLNAVEKSKF